MSSFRSVQHGVHNPNRAVFDRWRERIDYLETTGGHFDLDDLRKASLWRTSPAGNIGAECGWNGVPRDSRLRELDIKFTQVVQRDDIMRAKLYIGLMLLRVEQINHAKENTTELRLADRVHDAISQGRDAQADLLRHARDGRGHL
jgi:hypothetical protein